MPDKKISDLTSAGALSGSEALPIVQSGTTVKTLLSTISNYIRESVSLQKVTDVGNTTTHSINVDAVKFSLTPTNSPAAGQIAYIGNTGALSYLMNNSSVMSSIGQTLHAYVHNADSVTITKGQPVYLFSASGNKASVKLANNSVDSTSAKTLGLASENITAGQTGFITCQGVLDGLNTGSYTAGDSLYLGATSGALTNSKPYAPNHLVYIGMVERANNGNGQIYVRVQNGYELDEIHDCYINPSTLADNDVLTYESASDLWKNKPKYQDASIVGQWLTPPFVTKSSQTGGGGVVWFFPQLIGDTKTITEISCEVTTLIAGSNVRIALYDDDGTGLLPSNLVEDSGNLSSATTGLKSFTLSTPKVLNSNNKVYWTAIQISSNSVGIRSGTTVNYFSSASGLTAGIGARVIVQSFGAFPSSGLTSSVNTIGFNYFVHIKKSA